MCSFPRTTFRALRADGDLCPRQNEFAGITGPAEPRVRFHSTYTTTNTAVA
jgi:hypothetical protein